MTFYANTKRNWTKNWGTLSQEILDNSNLGATVKQAGANRVYLPDHFGPHPEVYHQRVFERLQDVTKALEAGSEAYSTAVKSELAAIAQELVADKTKNMLLGIGL